MYRRKLLTIFAMVLMGAGLWLGGCGEAAEPIELEEEENQQPDDENDDNDDLDDNDPECDEQDCDEVEDEGVVDFGQEWGEPQGPSGGNAATLLSAGDTYFAVQHDAYEASQLWRAAEGDDWTRVVELPDGEDPARIGEAVAYDGALYLFADNLLRSDDGGVTWQQEQFEGVDADEVATARVFDDELYVLAGPYRQGERIYRIVDGDAQRVDDGSLENTIVDFAIYGDKLLVSRAGHVDGLVIYDSSQGVWETADVVVDQSFAGVKLHLHADVVYATANAGIWRSQDGETFDKISDESAKQSVIVGDELIFGPVGDDNSVKTLEISDPTVENPTLEVLASYEGIYTLDLASNGQSLVASTMPDGLLHMDFGSSQWQQVSPSLRPLSNAAHTGERSWVSGANGELFYSLDGLEWTRLSLGGHSIEHMIAVDGGLSVVTRSSDFLRISQDGEQWSVSEAVSLDSGLPSELVKVGDDVFAGFRPKTQSGGKNAVTTVGGGLYRGQSPGLLFGKIGHDLPEDNTNTNRPPVYAINGTDDVIVLIGHNGIFRSTDGAASWQPTAVEGQFLTTEETYGSSNGRAWLAEADGELFAMTATGMVPKLWRSRDDGQTWDKVSMSLPQDTAISDLHAVGSVLTIATATQGVLGSVDSGESWEMVGENFRGGAVQNLRTHSKSLWAVTSRGMVELLLD